MKKALRVAFVGLALALVHGVVQAEGFLFGLEYESEKDQSTGITNRGLTLIPGWEFPGERLINRIEVLLERNRDSAAGSEGVLGRENKVFLRLRHDGELSERVEYYVRGGAGRSFNQERDFNFAYIEPGLIFKLNGKWEWVVAVRETNSIDRTPGERVHQVRLGPNVDLDKNNEIEFRYVAGRGDERTRSWLVEYVHRF